jgi:hypothetical protein
MTPFAEAYDYEFEPTEFATEFADEASRTRFRPGLIPGALSSATLNTPRGPATLNLPAPVATLAQFRALEQTVNATTQRVNAVQAGLARLNREFAARRREQESQATTMLLLSFLTVRRLREDFLGHTHEGMDGKVVLPAAAGGSSSIGSILPFLILLQPTFLGQSTTSSDGSMGGLSPILLLLLLDVL